MTKIEIEEITVAIDEVIDDVSLMVRAQLNEAKMAEYAEALRNGAVFPPLDCTRIDGDPFLHDGFHRLGAHRRVGSTEIRIRVRPGTHRDAWLAAVRAGTYSKLPFTRADKRKIVRGFLADPDWSRRSDRWIGGEAAVDHVFVGKLRREASTGDGHQLEAAKPTKRVGRDGKTRNPPKRKPRTTSKPAAVPPVKEPPVAPTMKFTPEQLGFPSPEIADEPDPIVTNMTRAQAWSLRWGAVHIQTPAQRVLDAKQKNLQSLSGAVRDLGEAARTFLRLQALQIPGTLAGEPGHTCALADAFTPEEYLAVAGSMDNGGALWRRKLKQHLDALLTALRIVESFAAVLRPTPTTDATPPTTEPTDDFQEMPACLVRKPNGGQHV